MTNKQRNTARAGYLMGGALGIQRFAGAQTMQDLMLATSLVLVELSIVWLIEKKAGQLEGKQDEWQGKEALRGQHESQSHSTGEELARRQKALDGTSEETHAIEEACQHDHLMSDPKALNSIAIHAVRSGYHAGVTHNYALLGGHRGKAA